MFGFAHKNDKHEKKCHCQRKNCQTRSVEGDVLSQIKPGETVEIIEIAVPCLKFKQRLMDLGIRTGKTVSLVRNAPLGDPMHLSVGNYDISIRKNEAQYIKVKVIK